MLTLTPIPLTSEAFSAYGEVVQPDSARNTFTMNFGLASRYYDLADVDITDKKGATCISLVHSHAIQLPFEAKIMEYHPHGSQLFYPLCQSPFLILVAPPATILDETKMELFISNGKQGVNYHKNVWHHYLMPLEDDSEFLVVDRKADDENCVMVDLKSRVIIKDSKPK